VQLRQRRHRLDDLARKQANQGWNDAGELSVATAEVAWPVQFVQEEPRGRPVALRSQQIGIGVRKPPLLELLECGNLCRQTVCGQTNRTLVGDESSGS
jgi:hypothetical protein